MGRPNALPISRRERATETCQKPNDLAREAVGCMGLLAGCDDDSTSLIFGHVELDIVRSQERYNSFWMNSDAYIKELVFFDLTTIY